MEQIKMIIKGDLIKLAKEGNFDVIVHGCNCFCTMGNGIAKTIKNKFPEVWQADQQTKKGDILKLGKVIPIKVEENGIIFYILNAYTQYKYWGSELRTDYNAIRNCFKTIKNEFTGKRIAYPMIGAGLGGGNWNVISKIIDKELEGENHTLVIWNKK